MSASAVEVVRPATCRTCGDPLLGFRSKSDGSKNFPVVVHVDPMREQCTIKAKGAFEFHEHVQERSPASIDATLAEIYTARMYATNRRRSLYKQRDAAVERPTRALYGLSVEEIAKQIDDVEVWIGRLGEWRDFLEAEFERRGGWLRYFLVTNPGGHVHRGMECTSCYDTTEYRWLVELADCDEAQMIEQYGMAACTVCFPNAPSHPAWTREEQERQAKAAKACPGSGEFAGFGSRWAQCSACGCAVSVTKNGNLRKHDRVTEEATS